MFAIPVTGETLESQTANRCNKRSVDIRSSRGFGVRNQQAFFDVRVSDPTGNRYLNSALP